MLKDIISFILRRISKDKGSFLLKKILMLLFERDRIFGGEEVKFACPGFSASIQFLS